MRSVLSGRTSRYVAAIRRQSAVARRRAGGARLATGALTALAALAPTMLVAMGVAVPGPGPGGRAPAARRAASTTTEPAGASGPNAKAGPPLYRIVGCRSHGTIGYRQGPPRREVAIGFDDGPWRDTPAFVRMLERSHARATFFVIGRQLGPADRAMLLRELRDGDVLGDHTFNHPELTRSPRARAELQQTIGAIRALTGYTPCVFRPPYGSYDASVVRTARSLGLATVLWNVDPSDYAQPGTRAIARRVLAQVRPGSIVISHDGGGRRTETLGAYPAIIAALRARGYRIVTIPELLGFRPIYVPCVRLCDGIGVPRSKVPHGAIIERAR